MYLGALEYTLPNLVGPTALPNVLAARKPNYALALGWSFMKPDDDGSIDRRAIHQNIPKKFGLLGRSPIAQFDNAAEAETLCETLGFEGAYISIENSASDLAEQCLRKLQSKKEEDAKGRYSAIIYTHATPEEDPNLTPAFRIQTAVDDDLSLPFSVSGSCAASFVSAVQVAETLLQSGNDDRPVLIVAADRFLPPVHSRIGSFTLFSDAASAIEVSSQPVSDGLRILGTMNRPSDAGAFDWNADVRLEDVEEAIASTTADLVQALLQDHGCELRDIAAVTPQIISETLHRRIFQKLPELKVCRDLATFAPKGNFATSSIPIALSAVKSSLKTGDLVLGWCSGMDGTVAIMLAEKG